MTSTPGTIHRHNPRTSLTYTIKDGELAGRAEQVLAVRGRILAVRRFRAQRSRGYGKA